MDFESSIVRQCNQPISYWPTSSLERLTAAPRQAMILLLDAMGAASAKVHQHAWT
jgi:hypothetical protein